MDASDLQDMIDPVGAMERDELEEFLQICQSTEDSPPEQLSILSLALYSKTDDMIHLDEALSIAEEVASADTTQARLLGVTIAQNSKSLLRATQFGLVKFLRLLLEVESTHAEDEDGDTVLHTAAYHGFDGIARELLKNGASPSICGGSGFTPMQYALNRGHEKVVAVLREFKAFLDVADDSRVPLHQIAGGDILGEIERAQRRSVFSASSTLPWMDRMRYVPGPGRLFAEPYVAISYRWGLRPNQQDPLTIKVPPRKDHPVFRKARASRDVLLRSLEYAEANGSKRIWIDQECIHQDDEDDKKDAMQNMHLVYRQATTTLVLLGRHVETAKDIAALHSLLRNVEEARDLKSRLMADPWFTRAWTTQEFGVTPPQQLRFLIGRKEGLDMEGYGWRAQSADLDSKPGHITQIVPRAWEFSHREMVDFAFLGMDLHKH
ncbi:heterokaryon incompatibility protein-domain-containing protein [Podospora fimiseda]|uniref:Heterokaryon incompatibility protein-domain-containing protein n=1 Tax=Podospora fimiseda TaxID=252190 RepID=A0AAN7BIT5_9PEZI|nr:heterokaryon incompatibility protein-domain-containing protein [Podospora fimiseda]